MALSIVDGDEIDRRWIDGTELRSRRWPRSDPPGIDLERRLLKMVGRGTEFVYFIRSGSRVKIGRSKNVRHRLESVRVANADEVYLIGAAMGGVILERDIHWAVRSDRVRGEWFELSDNLIKVMRRVCMWPIHQGGWR